MPQAARAMLRPDFRIALRRLEVLTPRRTTRRQVGSAIASPTATTASDQFAHPAGFVVTTPEGRVSRYILGLDPQAAELKQAVAEAALDRVEPPAHPLLLLCFGYDPDEGTAAALAMRLVRWVSAATVFGCAALILFLLRRRRAAWCPAFRSGRIPQAPMRARSISCSSASS